jgi:hypothetical protein
MKQCKVIKHSIRIEYTCPTDSETYTTVIKNPRINQGRYYEDWEYTAITFQCPHCKKTHSFEI